MLARPARYRLPLRHGWGQPAAMTACSAPRPRWPWSAWRHWNPRS